MAVDLPDPTNEKPVQGRDPSVQLSSQLVTDQPSLLRVFTPWLVYPVMMLTATLGAEMALSRTTDPTIVSSSITTLAAILIFLLERWLPYTLRWNRSHGDILDDAAHLAVSGIGMELAVHALGYGTLSSWGTMISARLGVGLWPVHWPLLLQLSLALVVSELGLYLSHRWFHRWRPLWRVHSIHHSAKRLYWLNSTRNHPIDALVSVIIAVAPLLVLGAGEPLLALYGASVGVHLLLQHSNVDLRLGALNWLISGAELHRWHHSRKLTEFNSNYGAVLTVWDLVFGTYHRPTDRLPDPDVGVDAIDGVPDGYLRQLIHPFRSTSSE
jgi:ornithine lipid hydroxylase